MASSLLTVANVAGISSAKIPIGDGVTALFAQNWAGKTSLLRALTAVLTGHTCLGTGSKKADGPAMVHDGAKSGSATLATEGAAITVTWPDCEVISRGDQSLLPRASEFAALQHFLDLDPKKRAQVFQRLFKVEPSRAELQKAFDQAKLDLTDEMWNEIDAKGWDGATKAWLDEARDGKAGWRAATRGATWGAKIGESWTAQPVTPPADDGEPPADLDKLMAAYNSQGELYATRLERVEVAGAALAKAADKLAKLPQPEDGADAQNCPCCQEPLRIVGGIIEAYRPLSDDEKRQRRNAIQDATNAVDRCRRGQEQALEAAESERRKWSAMGHQLNAAKARQEIAVDNSAQITAKAREIHDEIVRAVAIAEILGPDGLRKSKLDDVLDLINDSLADMSDQVGLTDPLRLEIIDGSLQARLGNRPQWLMSGAERWLCDALIRIEIARRDGSTIILLDEADRLTPANREALFGFLPETELQVVVTMALNDQARAPDLAAAGIGTSVWIDNGLARPIGRAQEAA